MLKIKGSISANQIDIYVKKINNIITIKRVKNNSVHINFPKMNLFTKQKIWLKYDTCIGQLDQQKNKVLL